VYGYARGVYSSRKIETRTFEDVAFRYLSGDKYPDHSTIAEFRKRHLDALYCLRAPVRTAALQTAESALAKTLTPTYT
jgi:transposase